MTKEHIILDQKSIGVSQYFFGLSERKNGIRYEDELEKCGIPTKTWKQAGQMELQCRNCDIGRSTYAKYENGELNIRISVLMELKKIYNCSYDEFFDDLDSH